MVTGRDGRLVAALATRRRDPVVPDLEPFIAAAGPDAFLDRYKQFTGHLAKHVVRCMGGEIDRKDVDVSIPGSRYTRATRYRQCITIIRHSSDRFTVTPNAGGSHGAALFDSRVEADRHAAGLQERLGGPEVARIIVHDLAGGA